ncbi:MAG TPA: isoaspartyl peptidase/L-asparaginase [Actinomycetota bacterium]|nr:isoaspartyl peptidase/L-asparaginase [Actinomycetota bacterium]
MALRLYVHGGVAGVAKGPLPSLRASIDAASGARAAVDAVELAIRVLEDDPRLNAGWGSVLSRAGMVELDAGIADGSTGRYGGVVTVAVRNPISLARYVMTESPHVLMGGPAAASLGDAEAMTTTTPEQHARWEEVAAHDGFTSETFGAPEYVDTVGAIAIDDDGHLAAGSSTGGVFGKMSGRIGDAAIFGAGLYASRSAAAVGTGVGEAFLETLACARIGLLIEGGAHPQAACEEVVTAITAGSDIPAAILALGGDGRVGAAYRGGAWAVEGPEGPITARQI